MLAILVQVYETLVIIKYHIVPELPIESIADNLI